MKTTQQTLLPRTGDASPSRGSSNVPSGAAPIRGMDVTRQEQRAAANKARADIIRPWQERAETAKAHVAKCSKAMAEANAELVAMLGQLDEACVRAMDAEEAILYPA